MLNKLLVLKVTSWFNKLRFYYKSCEIYKEREIRYRIFCLRETKGVSRRNPTVRLQLWIILGIQENSLVKWQSGQSQNAQETLPPLQNPPSRTKHLSIQFKFQQKFIQNFPTQRINTKSTEKCICFYELGNY